MNKIIYFVVCLLFFSISSSFAIERDAFIEEKLKTVSVEKPETNVNYNYKSVEKIPINLQIVNPINTKQTEITEGQIIDFCIKEDVKYNHKTIIKKGTIVKGKVQTYMPRGFNGIPGILIIDDFEISNIDKLKLKSTYIKRGQDRTLWLLPIKWALFIIPFAGNITVIIPGGHVKIKKKNVVKLYYYPDWNSNK